MAGSLADAQALNRYLFVGDDSTNAVDPSGRDATNCILSLAGGIVTALSSIAAVAGGAVGIAITTGIELVGAIFSFVGGLLGLADAAIILVAAIVVACGVSPIQVEWRCVRHSDRISRIFLLIHRVCYPLCHYTVQ